MKIWRSVQNLDIFFFREWTLREKWLKYTHYHNINYESRVTSSDLRDFSPRLVTVVSRWIAPCADEKIT